MLQSALGWSLLGKVRIVPLWIGTKANPADAPSREQALEPPSETPAWAKIFYPPAASNFAFAQEKGRKYFIEFWAGFAGLSRAVANEGLLCLTPPEAYTQRGYDKYFDLLRPSVQARYLQWADEGLLGGAHFGIPCLTWGNLFRLWQGGTRTRLCPRGAGLSEKEAIGNVELDFLLEMSQRILDSGGWITIENPLASYLKFDPTIQRWLADGTLHFYSMDQCAFGLRSPAAAAHREVWKKATFFLCSSVAFAYLCRRCDGRHLHTPLKGQIRVGGRSHCRTKLAARYPTPLCQCYARCAAAAAVEHAAPHFR